MTIARSLAATLLLLSAAACDSGAELRPLSSRSGIPVALVKLVQ